MKLFIISLLILRSTISLAQPNENDLSETKKTILEVNKCDKNLNSEKCKEIRDAKDMSTLLAIANGVTASNEFKDFKKEMRDRILVSECCLRIAEPNECQLLSDAYKKKLLLCLSRIDNRR